jgi:hypothetical protein
MRYYYNSTPILLTSYNNVRRQYTGNRGVRPRHFTGQLKVLLRRIRDGISINIVHCLSSSVLCSSIEQPFSIHLICSDDCQHGERTTEPSLEQRQTTNCHVRYAGQIDAISFVFSCTVQLIRKYFSKVFDLHVSIHTCVSL